MGGGRERAGPWARREREGVSPKRGVRVGKGWKFQDVPFYSVLNFDATRWPTDQRRHISRFRRGWVVGGGRRGRGRGGVREGVGRGGGRGEGEGCKVDLFVFTW